MAKDRADNEATLQYPFVRRKTPRYSDAELRDLLANQSRARKMLEEKYESELSGRYGVIEAQLEEIQKDVSTFDWCRLRGMDTSVDRRGADARMSLVRYQLWAVAAAIGCK